MDKSAKQYYCINSKDIQRQQNNEFQRRLTCTFLFLTPMWFFFSKSTNHFWIDQNVKKCFCFCLQCVCVCVFYNNPLIIYALTKMSKKCLRMLCVHPIFWNYCFVPIRKMLLFYFLFISTFLSLISSFSYSREVISLCLERHWLWISNIIFIILRFFSMVNCSCFHKLETFRLFIKRKWQVLVPLIKWNRRRKFVLCVWWSLDRRSVFWT